MRAKIIEECRKKMYDAIWLEIDRDPQRPAVARVDVETPAGYICIWCDPNGNLATIDHKANNHEGERLAEAIEGCVDYRDVMDDYFDECPDAVDQDTYPLDAFNDWRLDKLMEEFQGS